MSDTALTGTQPADGTGDAGAKPAEGMPAYVGQFSDDLKSLEVWKEHSTISDVARALIKSKADSKGSVKIPDAASSEDERKSFRKSYGVPDNADGYKLDDPGMPEGMVMDTERAKWFKEISHKLGLNQHQANQLFLEDSRRSITTFNVNTEGVKRGTDSIKQKWGVEYEANLTVANRAVSKFGSAEFPEYLRVSGLGNNPSMLEFCLAVGKAISEDTAPKGDGAAQDEVQQRKYPASPEMYKKR